MRRYSLRAWKKRAACLGGLRPRATSNRLLQARGDGRTAERLSNFGDPVKHHNATKAGNLAGAESNVAVTRHPSLRLWAPIMQSAKSAVFWSQKNIASSTAASSSNATSAESSNPDTAFMI